jgi:O-antigen ligase
MVGGMTPRFWVFVAFVLLVFLMGGGSRDDVSSLVILRPACAFFAAYALTVAAPGDFARLRVPLLLLLALGVWMVVQLIPLPPSVWGGLPDRAAVLAVDKLVGLEGTWRPISLSPSKTMNALASLVVPVSALLMYAVQAVEDRRRIVGLLIIVAAGSAALGMGQLASGSGPLYLYSITNDHVPVGLFANRNHNAVFLATIFIIASYWLAEHRRLAFRGDRSVRPILVAGVCLLIFGTLLSSQSRAGLLIGLLSIGVAAALYLAARRAEKDDDHPREGLARYWPMAAVLVVTVAVLFVLSQSTSFDRLATHSTADDIRVKVFPQIAAMAQNNWLLGTGFGSFEYAYRAHEASAWLNQTYLNNAHDDWLQWVIEGGLPAILIVLGFCGWIVRTGRARWREAEGNPALRRLIAMAFSVLVLLIVASALDYPLRVPSMMLYAILMTAFVADPPEPQLRVSSKRKPARERSGYRSQVAPAYSDQRGAVQ